MLRDYQIEICERVREAFARHRSVMVQMPTGTGKTVVLAELVREYLNVNLNGGRNVLIVAHRRELVEQIQQALLKVMGAEDESSTSFGKYPSFRSLASKKGLGTEKVFLPHPSSPARRGSTSLLNPPLLRREDLKPGRPGLYSQTSSRPCGVARELPTQQSCDYLSAEGAAARKGCDCLTREGCDCLKQEGCDCLGSEGAAAHIAVHSIQWLSRNIEKVKGKPGLVIVDEAHHALAKTYKMMWEAWPEAKFLGLTATPWRMSGEGFTDLFEVMVQSWSVKRFIAEGWLCAYDYYAVRPDSDDQRRIDSLTKRGTDGDYQTKEMREKLDDAPCIERLFETYMQHAKGMKGIVYAIDIEHAEHIAEYYKQQGVAAYAISSKTSLPERKRLIEAFRKSCFSEEKSSNDIFENHPPSPSLPLKKGLHRFPLNPLSPQGTGDLKPGRPGLYSQTSSRPCGVARELPTQQSCDCLCAEGAAAQEGSDCLMRESCDCLTQQGRDCLVQVLVSVDLFSEGFDCPDVEFIQMARPTLSLAKYLQMVGRGLRAHKGKACCTIIDNVGLYRAFGLPSADRDWNDAFCGYANERIKELWFLKIDTGWFPSSLLENRGDNVVKIVSHEGMTDQYKELDNTGFERMQNKDGRTVWRDRVNGVTFEHKPVVVDFSGLELSTEDGVMLYPRIASPLIDKDNGIHYNLLKMQVGDGILWKKRYVSLSNPARVYRLEETHQNGLRVFRDDWGNVYLQQDPDHSPVAETDVSREEMMSCCNEGLQRLRRINDDVKNNMRAALINKYPVMIIEETLSEEKLQRITLADRKMRSRTERWLDLKTDYVYSQKPEIIKRGWVELAQVDGLVYVRNIHGLSGWAFPNYDIRMDERLCVIGNVLVMRNRSVSVVYEIVKKSEDMTMFIVDNLLNRYMIINKPGMELEKHYLSK